jgi:hypothetical protein
LNQGLGGSVEHSGLANNPAQLSVNGGMARAVTKETPIVFRAGFFGLRKGASMP